MAFADTQSFENAFNAANSFVRTKQDATGSEWLDTANSTPSEPRGFRLKHSTSGKGVDAIDRHLIQFYQTKLDSLGVPRTGVINVTLSFPRATVITSTIMYNIIANTIDLLMAGVFATSVTSLTTTNVDKLLRGEQ
jgi:hypothetical protein